MLGRAAFNIIYQRKAGNIGSFAMVSVESNIMRETLRYKLYILSRYNNKTKTTLSYMTQVKQSAALVLDPSRHPWLAETDRHY